MAANTTSGNFSSYQDPGIRIFQGLKPDIVAIQEFRYNASASDENLRLLVDTAFGTNFYYYREPYTSGGDIPNGIVSRWPIIASNSWDDVSAPNRGFAWALIDLPGTNDLYVVSVHLLTSSSGTRATEAAQLKSLIQSEFPANAWVILGGDMNTGDRGETAIDTFKTFLSDSPIPDDGVASPNQKEGTNANRDNPYDYVLPSFSLTNFLAPAVVGSRTFPKGLVFDSRVYTPLTNAPGVLQSDSDADNMQHMAVIKDFLIPIGGANTNPPSIATQPLSQTNAFGGNATFTVTATGAAPLSYQWRFFGTNISSATASSYALTNLQPTNAGDYTVVITNAVGSITSAVATLTVNAAPFINSQPQSLSVNLGANAAFNVTAAGGTPLFYQWRFAGNEILGATNSSFTRSNAQPADAGNYTVVVTNYAGSVTSVIAALTVNVTPPGIIAQWNFNSVAPDASTGTGTLTPSIGSGTVSYVSGAAAAGSGEFAGGSSADPAASDNSGWNTSTYPAATVGNKTRGVQVDVNTSGKQNIVVTWSSQSSNAGNKYARLQYTTNSTTYFDFPTATTNGTSFTSKTNDLSGFAGVNNNPAFAIRILSEFESTATGNANASYVAANAPATTYNTTGTMRYDMVTISGSPIVSGTAPVITNQPTGQATAQGASATFSVGADGTAPLNYQWRFNLADISGATSSSYTRSNVQPTHVGNYSVIVSNSAGFTTSTNAPLSLIIPQPVLTTLTPGILQWQGLSNLTYTVQTSTNLTQTNWPTLGTATAPTTTLFFTNTPATNTERYYRVVYP